MIFRQRSISDSIFSKRKKLNYPLMALLVLVPLQNIYIDKIPSLYFGLNAINILLLLSFLFSLRIHDSKYMDGKNRFILFIVFAYVFMYFRSLVYNNTYYESDLIAFKDTLVPFALFVIMYKSCNSIENIKRYFYCTLVPLPYMFKVFNAKLSWMGFSSYRDKLRMNNGTFINLGSNEIAAFYATYVFVIIYVALNEKNVLIKWSLYFLAALNAYCLIFGFSRGGYLSAIAGGIAMVLSLRYNKQVVVIALFIALMFIFGSDLLPNAVTERFQSIFTEDTGVDENIQSRLQSWIFAIDTFYENALSGIGFNNFRRINPLKIDAHNYYLKILVEGGLVASIFMLLFFRGLYKNVIKMKIISKDSFLRGLGKGFLPCTAAILIGNVFGDRFSHYPLISYYYVYMAIILAGSRLEDSCEIPSGNSRSSCIRIS